MRARAASPSSPGRVRRKAVRQYLAADLVDEMEINLVPIFPGDGERLFEALGAGNPRHVHVGAVSAPGVTRLKFARTAPASAS